MVGSETTRNLLFLSISNDILQRKPSTFSLFFSDEVNFPDGMAILNGDFIIQLRKIDKDGEKFDLMRKNQKSQSVDAASPPCNP